MIFGKMWSALRAQLNKVANWFYTADPIAQLQYEYDQAVEQLKGGRQGLEQYRALVERVARQVIANELHVKNLEQKVKAYLTSGDRDTAGKFVLELQKAKNELAENQNQLKMHEEAYNNNLAKVKHATSKLQTIKDKIQKYDADLKMSRAEAELAELSKDFNFDVTTDFGQIEGVIQEKIDKNRAKVRVAVDMSGQGMDELKKEQAMEKAVAEQALRDFEAQLGMVSPETVKVTEATKDLGPAQQTTTN
ncbi:MAG: PspA/IM30 family protein [Planctomycetaceae bacterium]|jgi:phage shock protein A